MRTHVKTHAISGYKFSVRKMSILLELTIPSNLIQHHDSLVHIPEKKYKRTRIFNLKKTIKKKHEFKIKIKRSNAAKKTFKSQQNKRDSRLVFSTTTKNQ